MLQTGKIVEIKGNIAKVECCNDSECEMCENAAGCAGRQKPVYSRALNRVGAAVGDTVVIDTDTRKAMKNAILLFIFPILVAVAVFFVAGSFLGEGISIVLTLASMLLTAAVSGLLMNRTEEKRVPGRIVKIVR